MNPDNSTTIFNHQTRKCGELVQARIDALGIGQKMQDLPEELWHKSFRYYVKDDPNRKGGPNLRMIRLDPNKPSLTVTGYVFNKFVHPYENRFITPREAARLQGFPDDLEFKGSLSSVQRQIGDAVPIELGEALFKSLLDFAETIAPQSKALAALSLFSGSGGLDIAAKAVTGAHGAIWDTLACVENDQDRCETLSGYFHDELRVFQDDIQNLNAEALLQQLNKSKEDIWLVYGGPPCQSFSQAGKQRGTRDPRGDLIFEFLRFVEEISPPLFLMENVANLKGIAKGQLLRDILDQMEALGYNVVYRVLNAAHYGTAQRRKRLILLGTRKDIGSTAAMPEASHAESGDLFGTPPFKTVAEAFADLPPIAD